MSKQELLDAVIEQIIIDIENKDVTALEELLKTVDSKYLRSYLPEE